MSMGELGALLLGLAIVSLLGQVWFFSVELVLSRFKRLLERRREPPAWHTLPKDKEEEKHGRSGGDPKKILTNVCDKGPLCHL